MFEGFPYTNFHELNLDWIIKIAKKFLDQYTHIQEIIEDGETALDEKITDGLADLDAKATELEGLLDAWYNTHSEDIANQLTEAVASLNQAVIAASAAFNQAANQKAAETLASIPADYTTLANEVNDLALRIDNMFHEVVVNHPFVSGQTNLWSERRAFPNEIIPADSILEEVSMYIGAVTANAIVTLEIWLLNDSETSITRDYITSVTGITANTTLTFPINRYSNKKRIISIRKNECYVYFTPSGGPGLFNTTDLNSTSFAMSDLTFNDGWQATFGMRYIISTEKEYLTNYGTRVLSYNYLDVLPDLDTAPQNTIYDIFQCLHSIEHIPAIEDSLTSATFWSVKGDNINSKNWLVQFLVPNGQQTRLYMRSYFDGSFKPWIELATTTKDANLLSLDYYNATCVDKISIGNIIGKTVLAFGDSITAGNTNTSWTYHYANMASATVINKAVPGASFGKENAESAAKYVITQLQSVTSEQWSAAEIIIVSAGTNDGLINTTMTELAANVLEVIQAIRQATNKPIVFITPIRRNSPTYNENLKVPNVAGVISNVALMNDCNVIDGYTFPIPSQTIDGIVNCTRDGLHPDMYGANIYARAIINAMM